MPDKARMIETVFQRELFDPAWYRDTYPDVGMLGMEPDYHYRTYGHLMGRDPSAEFSTSFMRRAFGFPPAANPVQRLQKMIQETGSLPAPPPNNILRAANELASRGAHERAITLARRYLPPDLAYSLHILQANQELRIGDGEAGWLRHINAYLDHYRLSHLQLEGEGTLFTRLASAPQPAAITEGPLISIIMAAYNAEATVAQAARSILNQNWRNLELLIVDDCSDDGTWPELQKLAEQDGRVRVFRNAVNVGPYVSKNIALSHAKGAWVTGQDADDWSHPERLATHIGFARQKSAAASTTRMIRMHEDGFLSRVVGLSDLTLDGAATKSSISCLYDREFLANRVGFWDCARFGADSEMINRIGIALGHEVETFDTVGMLCLDLDTGLSKHEEWGIDHPARQDSPRQKYRRAWLKWHEALTASSDLYMPFPQKDRRFIAENGVTVSAFDVRRAARTATSNNPRLVFTVGDLSAIGGIASRTRNVISNSAGRACKYVALSRKHERPFAMEGAYSCETDTDAIRQMLASWEPDDTVFFISNNTHMAFPKDIRDRIKNFPVVSISAGQMAFMIQDSTVLSNLDYVEGHKASRIISFSDADISFQRQLGIYGQVKGFAPVKIREENSYRPDKNIHMTYVGRIDFHAKDCGKLIGIATELKKNNLPPIRVFTTDGKNSPDLNKFVDLTNNQGLAEQFDFIYNCEDKDKIYSEIKILIMPSKKESFGNAVLEAFSYGVPVLAASYAPGPAELIGSGNCGLLLDDMSGPSVMAALNRLTDQDYLKMSSRAFDHHKNFSIEAHLDFLEGVARDVIRDFDGENRLPVLPNLKLIEAMKKP